MEILFCLLAAIVAVVVVAVIGKVCTIWTYYNRAEGFLLPTFLVVFFGGMILFYNANSTLFDQNEDLLKEWTAAQCVAPETIARSVYIADKEGDNLTGTAFLLEGDLIVTNRHVSDAITAEAMFTSPNGDVTPGQLFFRASEETSPDLAFYYAKSFGETPRLPLATVAPQVGERLLVVGNNGHRERFHPSVVTVLGDGTEETAPKVSPSPITWVYGTSAEMVLRVIMPGIFIDAGSKGSPYYTSHGDTGPGNSGSPVVNCAGEVVGVHFGGDFYMFASEQRGMAVTLEGLEAEIAKLPGSQSDNGNLNAS